MDDQINQGSLSRDTIVKVKELKRLVYKYHQYQNIDLDGIVKWTVHGAIKGDTKFLDDKLDLLHTTEKLASR